jgi:hypothetical protein
MEAAAVIAATLMAALAGFQVALAAGVPWGAAAYGGTWPGVLPRGIRINSLVFGAAVYPVAILYVLDAGGVVESSWLPGSRTAAMWVMVAFFALGTVANLASRSRIERLWGPVALVIAVCCAVVAVG